MSHISLPGERFAFDEKVWAEEVERFHERGAARAAARRAREEIERPGARIPVRGCEARGPDGTALSGCAKVYVPIGETPAAAPYGLVFALRTERDNGELMLQLMPSGDRWG